MRRADNRAIRELAKAAEAQGWTVTRCKNNHLRFAGPDGALVHTGGTPSDHRALKNLRAQLRRGGLAI